MRKMENTRFVNKGIVKKDAKALLSGRPVYTDDIAPSDCLVVKLLRSCLLYTSPSPRDRSLSRMPSSA